jgi:hypothetical protein
MKKKTLGKKIYNIAELGVNLVSDNRGSKIASNKLDYPQKTAKEKYIYNDTIKLINDVPNVIIRDKKVVLSDNDDDIIYIYERFYGIIKYAKPKIHYKGGEKIVDDYYVAAPITKDEELENELIFRAWAHSNTTEEGKYYSDFNPHKPHENQLYRILIEDTRKLRKQFFGVEDEPYEQFIIRANDVSKNITHLLGKSSDVFFKEKGKEELDEEQEELDEEQEEQEEQDENIVTILDNEEMEQIEEQILIERKFAKKKEELTTSIVIGLVAIVGGIIIIYYLE